jgi:hypothetical protein
MQQLWFIDKPITQHVSGSIVPIFRSTRLYTTAYGFQHLNVLAGVLGRREAGRVHCVEAVFQIYTVYTTCLPASQDSSQHPKCWKPYAVVYSLALLKMGTMVPETCWVIGLSINHNCCIKLGRPKQTWRRSVHNEALEEGNSWGEVKKLARNRIRWRRFVDTLCP